MILTKPFQHYWTTNFVQNNKNSQPAYKFLFIQIQDKLRDQKGVGTEQCLYKNIIYFLKSWTPIAHTLESGIDVAPRINVALEHLEKTINAAP